MRTNIVLNPDLVREAMTLSKARSKRELIDEALRTYVEVKTAEQRRASYESRFDELTARLEGLELREAPHKILRADRDRR